MSTHTTPSGVATGRTTKELYNRGYNRLICILDILNTGANTHFSTAFGTYSAIDISIASPILTTVFDWRIHFDLCSSDHFPIVLAQLQRNLIETRRPKWKIKNANWQLFSTLANIEKPSATKQIDQIVSEMAIKIIDAATETIPKTAHTPKRAPVPWWSEEVSRCIQNRKKALARFNRAPSQENLSAFRLTRAQARRTIREAKKQSWIDFVSSLNEKTPWSNMELHPQNFRKKQRQADTYNH